MFFPRTWSCIRNDKSLEALDIFSHFAMETSDKKRKSEEKQSTKQAAKRRRLEIFEEGVTSNSAISKQWIDTKEAAMEAFCERMQRTVDTEPESMVFALVAVSKTNGKSHVVCHSSSVDWVLDWCQQTSPTWELRWEIVKMSALSDDEQERIDHGFDVLFVRP